MLQTNKNKIALALKDSGVALDWFSWLEPSNRLQLKIQVKESQHYFLVEQDDDNGFHRLRYTRPGMGCPATPWYVKDMKTRIDTRKDGQQRGHAELRIENVVAYLNIWLNETVRPFIADKTTPDLWSQMIKSRAQVQWRGPSAATHGAGSGASTGTAIMTFSDAQKTHMLDGLNHLHDQLTQQVNDDPLKVEIIEDRLDYIKNAVPRTDHIMDIKNILLGVALDIVINLSVDAETGRQIMLLFQHLFESAASLLH